MGGSTPNASAAWENPRPGRPPGPAPAHPRRGAPGDERFVAPRRHEAELPEGWGEEVVEEVLQEVVQEVVEEVEEETAARDLDPPTLTAGYAEGHRHPPGGAADYHRRHGDERS